MIIDLTIDQVSQIVGVPQSRLRYWEEVFGVPVRRTATRRRHYSQEAIDIMKRIKELNDYGFSSKGIKRKLGDEKFPQASPEQ